MNNYTVAVNLEDIDTGIISLHQASFIAQSRPEAIGMAVEKFQRTGNAIHSYKVTISGTSYDSDIVDLLQRGRRIEAIKLRREQSGSGLKEAKEWTDEIIEKLGLQTVSFR